MYKYICKPNYKLPNLGLKLVSSVCDFDKESSRKDQYMSQLEMFINYSTKIYSSSLLDYENIDSGKQSDHHQQLVLNSTEKEIQKKNCRKILGSGMMGFWHLAVHSHG